MAGLDGASIEESASLLHQLLVTEEQGTRPRWYACDPLEGKRLAFGSQVDVAWECLRQAALYGMRSPFSEDGIPS
jgi:hypothetical protein